MVIVIDIHSFVDVITNSSTSVFVCDTQKSLETVKEQLEMILDTYRTVLPEQEEREEYQHDPYLDFENVFGSIYVYTKEKYLEDKKENEKWTKKYGSDSYLDYAEDHQTESNIGKIIIHSASDNSIPYSLFELIENAFNSRRYHY